MQEKRCDLKEFIKNYFRQSDALIGNKSRFKILSIKCNTLKCLYALKLKKLSETDQEILGLLLADLILEIARSNGEALEIIDLRFANGELIAWTNLYGALGLRAIDAMNFVLVRELRNLIVNS